MLIEVSVPGDNLPQVRRKILRVGERAVHARPAFEAMGEALFRIERAQFASEGHRGSGGWAPLQPSTVEKRGSAHPILDDSGALRQSLTERGGDNVFIVADDFLAFGTSDPQGERHQAGTSRMPRRRPLEPTEADKVGFVKIMQGYIFGDEQTSLAMAAALGA